MLCARQRIVQLGKGERFFSAGHGVFEAPRRRNTASQKRREFSLLPRVGVLSVSSVDGLTVVCCGGAILMLMARTVGCGASALSLSRACSMPSSVCVLITCTTLGRSVVCGTSRVSVICGALSAAKPKSCRYSAANIFVSKRSSLKRTSSLLGAMLTSTMFVGISMFNTQMG